MKAAALAVILALCTAAAYPAYSEVRTAGLAEPSYERGESMMFSGINGEAGESVVVIIRDSGGKLITYLDDPFPDADGSFETSSRKVGDAFTKPGLYNATVFSNNEAESTGIVLQLRYDGEKIFLEPDFVLKLEPIEYMISEEGKKISFTARLADGAPDDAVFSLDANAPAGSSIHESTGAFSWVPAKGQGSEDGRDYTFSINVQKDSIKDSRQARFTIVEPAPEQLTPRPAPAPVNTPAPIPTAAPAPVPAIPRPASAQPDTASFVEPGVDPQVYVDRYNSESNYKKWFDDNYKQYSSIYEAVGLDEPELGECGIGTELVDDQCIIASKAVEKKSGCLIATAAYGSEMAPQVQFLREIRDNTLYSTDSGSILMDSFSSVYYTFSPGVADLERSSPEFREAVRLFITPMLASFSIISLAQEGSEAHVLGLGALVIALNLGMYVAAPAALIRAARSRFKRA